MQEGVIKNMTDLQSKYLVKMNDNCRLQNNLSETKTNTSARSKQYMLELYVPVPRN